IAHSEAGIDALVRRLDELEVARIAIEQPNGLVVDRLLDAGIAVVPVHPNQLAAARDRYRAGGGKSDGFDAYVLAELARTDIHRFRLLEPDSDETKALRALTRTREDLVEQRVALANQLRAQLDAFWPGAKRIFADVDSPIALAFLERYPSPTDGRSLGAKRLAGFLARNGYCGRRSPDELLERLRTAPQGRTGEAELEARRAVVLALVAALKPLVEQIRLLTSQIAGATRAHDDGQIFLSLFRDPKSVVTAAELLAPAAFREDRYAQAFPNFGSERMGAPVISFCRIDDKPIRTREPVTEPDALIIQDPTLLHQADLFAGLGREGYMLINSTHGFDELGLGEFVKGFHRDRLLVVPASSLALTHLGRPLPGAQLLGGFAALTWAVSLDSVVAAIEDKFTGQVAAGNVAAARAAFDFVREAREALTDA
ncbi:MAG: 2-oxoacid:acceptor oxidoreductase family protein, partial [Solirubrobacteraceae bacterium]